MMMPMQSKRRGVITPLSAVLAVLLFGMVAFAVDLGWIAVVKSDLQNAADSAALAGANPLMDNFVLYNLPTQSAGQKAALLSSALASARAKAKEFAAYNAAGGVNSLKLLDSDIEFGFLDAANKYTPISTYSGYPNTVKVTIRRDETANGKLGLFFGGVFGLKTTKVTSTASATLYSGTLDSFTGSTGNVGLLPMTYDVNHWYEFLKSGKGPDGIALTDLLSGNPVLQAYPSVKFKGNFGQLSLNDSHVGNSTEVAWVIDGVPKGDIQVLLDHNLIPLSKHDVSKWDWQGDTGFKASLVSTVNDFRGKTFMLPLFKPANSGLATYQAGVGQGSDYFYNIVEFVGVKIMPAAADNKMVMVTPAAVIEPNAVFVTGTIAPSGTSPSQSLTTFTTPRLSH